ncbi:hypothetical protein HQ545_02820 [Candidatus Woesearchaeota archaeon]|nr:hypothetical protein [Candidatus Woesearchaeota archaeon]
MKKIIFTCVLLILLAGCVTTINTRPEKCILPPGVDCLEFSGSKSAITMILQNSAGFDMEEVSVHVTTTTAKYECNDIAGDAILKDGEKDTFTCAGLNLSEGLMKSILDIDYTNAQTILAHRKSGELNLEIS